MKTRKFSLPFVGLIGLFSLVLSSCSIKIGGAHKDLSESLDEQGNLTVPMDVALDQDHPEGYQEGIVLVKSGQFKESLLGELSYKDCQPLSEGSLWYRIELSAGQDTISAVNYLRNLGTLETVDYDYVMSSGAEIETVDVSANPMASDLPYIESQGIGWAWGHLKHQDKDPGGSSDVIVAVIDTGVDYNHIDLRNNIWTNAGEIPDNHIDDDGNGFVDDVHGWNCVGNNNNPIDDNGHGTHVAGIIAAENNNIGTVGVAFNCKIMPIKAGNSSGYFLNSDLVKAVQYAYMNGASVINMSLGGYSISSALEDALIDAYSQCVLVAAAGNDELCNEPLCVLHPNAAPCYPAALPYVLGIMSCNQSGSSHSGFSNFDHNSNNQYEYEVYACGEQVPSTWPNNKYAYLNGTSMAAPIVSGIAALLRSAYPDRNTFSNKYINSQICNTGTRFLDGEHSVANIEDALTKIPTPKIHTIYNHYIADSSTLSNRNNGDYFINPGETIKLGFEFMNKGGKASNVHVQVNATRNNDPDLTDPYIHFLTSEFDMDDIGTYSIGEGGKHYEDGFLTDIDNAAVLIIDELAPNKYISTINVTVTYRNGLDPNDTTVYQGKGSIDLEVTSGMILPSIITEDTIFPATQKYILSHDMIISSNVTVTFEAGCMIEGYGNQSGEISTLLNAPSFIVYGTLIFDGNANNRISLTNSWTRLYFIQTKESGIVYLNYCDLMDVGFGYNASIDAFARAYLDHCTYRIEHGLGFRNGTYSNAYLYLYGSITNSIFEPKETPFTFCGNDSVIENSLIRLDENGYSVRFGSFANNNVFMGGHYGNAASKHNLSPTLNNNVFMQERQVKSLSELASFAVNKDGPHLGNITRGIYRQYASYLFTDNIDSNGNTIIDFFDEENHDASVVWPFIENIELFDHNGSPIQSVSRREQATVRVTFSTDIDTEKAFSLTYGSIYPYSDYKIVGDFVSSTVWEGTFEVTALIEGGIQRFRASGGYKADDAFKVVINSAEIFSFNIDSSSAMSMDLQASPQEDGVHLTWVQDDYDTLMGYNIYRSDSKDGNFVRLNRAVIPAGENEFIDDNAEPGKTYWYTFTVVFSDFSESIPAGKVSATCLDTIAPNIYHTPVNQGYLGNNLVISCTASDNVSVASATLYYRVKGNVSWQTLGMAKQNNRFSAAIFGNELSLDGMEYYIEVSDGRNVTRKGSAESPYSIVIQDASSIATLGDVDGDGVVTTRDALMIVRAINGDIILTDDQFQRADLNKDGELSSVEALRILQYVNGKVSTLEM